MATRVKKPAAAGPSAAGARRETEHLRFAPQILARLGEELNPNPDQGVLELVRNAYDADATRCVVELLDIVEPGGSIRIRDWGDGLSRKAVADGWLVLGRSSKSVQRRTAAGRLQVGQKGLGRLAALRLGESAMLRTWPRTNGAARARRRHTVELDWAAFDDAEVIEDVPVEVLTEPVGPTECGTEIVIHDLRSTWTRPEVKRLARALLLLADPFGGQASFELEFVCPEYPDLENLVAGSYFDYSRFQVTADIDGRGRATARLVDPALGIDEVAQHDEIIGGAPGSNRDDGDVYETVPARFELFGFLRSAEALHGMGTAATLDGLRSWLDTFGGVHVYHRGLRVAPYGDQGFDWLDMNLLRARNPELRPSTQTALGRMIVEDARGRLVQKTDRSGFIEDERFLELRDFGRDVLEWVGQRRNAVVHEQRARDRQQGPQRRAETEEQLEKVVDKAAKKLPPKQRAQLRSAVRSYKKAAGEDAEQLRKDLLLYRTLATVGTTSAQIAHETYNPALTITELAQEIEEIAEEEFGAYEPLRETVDRIQRLAGRLRGYAYLPRVLLAEPRRQMQVFAPSETIAETIEAFATLLERHSVEVVLALDAVEARLRGPVALLDAVVANLVINAVHALDDQAERPRQILVRTSTDGREFVLEVADSGYGIQELSTDEIWYPGQTTTPDGTGLGLTIVRDSASQLGGRVGVVTEGELGGAHFTARLPLAT